MSPGTDDRDERRASDRERVLQLTAAQAECGTRLVAAIDEMVPIADELARLVAERRAIDNRLRLHRHGPDVLELAAVVIRGRLSALRSHLEPFESSAAADTAAALLCRDRQLELTYVQPASGESRRSW